MLVCTYVPLVCVCKQIGTCLGRRAPPRHRWAYLCARRVAHARRSARRLRRRPRHTHRTPFGPTPSRPVRSESASVPDLLRYTPTRAAHTTFSLFRLFYFILSPFVSRFLSTHANPTVSPRTYTQTHTHAHINQHKRSVARRDRRTSTTKRHRTGAPSRYYGIARFAYTDNNI